MWPVGTDGVMWSVCQSVSHDSETCKGSLANRDAVWDVDSVGPIEPCIRREAAILRGITWRFYHTPPSTIPSGLDVRISPQSVKQCSDWPATEIVECHIKFSQRKIPAAMQSDVRIL